ncbi:MAG: DUF1588 domain-containing protein, partial [Planctomycetaceae bacterium]
MNSGILMHPLVQLFLARFREFLRTPEERFEVVEEAQCWRCHRKMNPLGMPFEAYNHVGRWRETEQGKPVNTSGAISHTGDDSLDRDVENVR